MLLHYVPMGVHELDQDKITPLLRLRHQNSIADTVADLGRPEDIGQPFFRLPEVSLREFCLILAWLMQACHDEQIVPGKPMRLILLLWLADTLTIFWRAGDRSRLPAHSESHFCCCV
ncbi:MAG: hypothetical protein WBN80_13380 [Prochlorococcaceae cyanobacterium]